MKEITDNLKQDMKALLSESAGTFTGFFKRGACTVRAVADKWKAFASDISDAVDTLMKPPFAEGGREAPATELSPEAEPIVTVMESITPDLPIGREMTLSQANEEIGHLDRRYQDAEWTSQSVKVKIDYTRDGQTDRYWLPLEIGLGGDLLEQMKGHLDKYHTDPEMVSRLFETVPVEHRQAFEAGLTPFVNENVNELSTGLLHYFHRHCDIAALEKQFDAQASILPEKEQQPFREAAAKTVAGLRRTVNTGAPIEPPAAQKAEQQTVGVSVPQTEQERPRQSVRVQLHKIKESANGRAVPHKVRIRPIQPGR